MSYLLAIDQGTTGTTVILFDEGMRPVSRAYQESNTNYPRPGWVEQDPREIYQGVLKAIGDCLESARVPSSELTAIGIVNQRETTVLWDRTTGEPLCPAVIWQCRRSIEYCERVRRYGFESAVRTRTGLILDPYFSATKISWLLDEYDLRDLARKNQVAFGTIDSWLLFKLTGGEVHATDHSNASRTLLYNIYTQDWDEELLAIFSVPASVLPVIQDNASSFGVAKAQGVLPDGIPITGMAGDQQASLFGQRCLQAGMAKNTYGTGCFLLSNTGARILRPTGGLLTTVAWRLGGVATFAIEGSVFEAGSAVQWLRDGLGVISAASEIEELARSVPDTGGVYLVPAFSGLGAPHWDPYARGAMFGLTRGTNKAHLARATLEAIAFQTFDLLDQMKIEGARVLELRADGGASGNDLLMQLQADILGLPIVRSGLVESTALGAAMLAGLGVGMWKSPEEIPFEGEGKAFLPEMEEKKRSELLRGWKEAVDRSRGWAKPCVPTSP
ncbi:MAG TPA: glycerol kinase [Cyanobacteria bacterium UBA8530]|nr:glycerol kinase [Cyanobacteria bacterium UBA8530]